MEVMEEAVVSLGCNAATAPRLRQGATHFDDLAVVEGGRVGPQLLSRLRERLTVAPLGGSRSKRRVFLSREGAHWRRLLNHGEIAKRLGQLGFEVVRLEGLTFRQQVDLFSAVSAVVAPHGAGLANIVWCPPGCTVIELGSSTALTPDYYRLALSMGHDYWLVEAALEGGRDAAYCDLRVDVDEVEATVRLALSQPPEACGRE